MKPFALIAGAIAICSSVAFAQPYPAKPGYDNTTGWGTPEISQIMQDLTGRLTPTHNAPAAPIVTSPSTTCGSLFTDPAGDDSYSLEGE